MKSWSAWCRHTANSMQSTRPGSRTLEGLAEYSDGTMGTFGPQTVNCPAASGVRFELRP